jgi:hypothetical protein
MAYSRYIYSYTRHVWIETSTEKGGGWRKKVKKIKKNLLCLTDESAVSLVITGRIYTLCV